MLACAHHVFLPCRTRKMAGDSCFHPPSASFLSSKGRVASLGMFIIDHFEVTDVDAQTTPVDEPAIGGGGIFDPLVLKHAAPVCSSLPSSLVPPAKLLCDVHHSLFSAFTSVPSAFPLADPLHFLLPTSPLLVVPSNPPFCTDLTHSISPAMTAARHFLGPSHCSLLVDRGTDFPPEFATKLESMGEEMIWFRQRQAKTTRAVNVYSGSKIGEGHQSFRYLSPQLHLTPKDLILPPSPFAAPYLPEWIHVVCVTERAKSIGEEMRMIRDGGLEGGLGEGWKGKLLWEPLGRTCVPSELTNTIEAVRDYAVFSPNLLEMQCLLSITPSPRPDSSEVEVAATLFRDMTMHQNGISPVVVVRAGEMGSYTIDVDGSGFWVPAYWREDEQHRVVDPTGGGNAFCGGLIAGLLISEGDVRKASIYAATAASFAIQQRGLPSLTTTSSGRELWNGDDPWARLREMADRSKAPQMYTIAKLSASESQDFEKATLFIT